MLVISLALLATVLEPGEDLPRPGPRMTGIFPPGITRGTSTTWTITGWNLAGVATVSGPDRGLHFGPPQVDPTGRSLTVAVLADADLANDYHEIRVVGPRGISNLALSRGDDLPQVVEVEPNDRAAAVEQVIRVGTAVAGIIRPLDVDRFRIEGTPGQSVTLDWETRRLGTAILPVLTVTGPHREAIRQVRSLPGGDRDCRTAVAMPAEGWIEVELRDNTFGGDDRARYRLRVSADPFASGMFPLGGPRGGVVELAEGGGNIPEPAPRRVNIPWSEGVTWLWPRDLPGIAAFEARNWPPGRFRVGDPDWPEVCEPVDHPAGQPWVIPEAATGVTINGRIDRPGQVDRFRVEARAGDRIRARVEAAVAGSFLDSVVTILGPRGERLGENDDRQTRTPLEPPGTIDGSSSTDSEVDVAIRADGPITVELADRFGGGGPEYGYRLELGPPRADFSVHLLRPTHSADPAPEARSLGMEEASIDPDLPGMFGVFNLAPGSTTSVPFVIVPRGRPGTIDLEVTGLPAQVRTERVTVRTSPAPRAGSRAAVEWDAPAETHAFRLQVPTDAAPAVGTFRIIARNRSSRRREADAVVGVDAAGGPERPVIRRLTAFPIRITTGP